MIELIKTHQKFPGDIINDVKSGRIHIFLWRKMD